MVHFTSKYRHLFCAEEPSIIHTDHKPLVGFMNALEHEDIYARWANKLRSLNIRICYIEGKKNQVADGLSRVIFNDVDCHPDQLVKELYTEVKAHEDDLQWFWKSGKGGYQDMLKTLSEEDQKRRAEEYGDRAIAKAGWTSFCVREQGEEPSSDLYTSADYSKEAMPYSVVCSLQVGTSDSQNSAFVAEKWYSDIYAYYVNNSAPEGLDKPALAAFKRKVNNYRWDHSVGRLLHRNGDNWCACITSKEVAPLLQEVHDEAGHFSSNIVLHKIKNKVYWPYTASDVRTYILGCLRCAQWAVAARQVPLSPIQVYQPYDLFGIDFMDWPEASKYGYKHIFNMVDYFSGVMFPYPTMSTGVKDVKQSLNYYQSGHHPLPSAVYCDAGSAFKSTGIKETFNEVNIICVIAFSQSHKSVGAIERANRTLRAAMNKMKTSGEDLIDLLRRAAPACNERHVEHLGYTPLQILHGIDFTSVSVRSLRALAILEKVVLPSPEDMLPLVWDHMARREELRKDVIHRTTKAKQRMKERYDRGVVPREFNTWPVRLPEGY